VATCAEGGHAGVARKRLPCDTAISPARLVERINKVVLIAFFLVSKYPQQFDHHPGRRQLNTAAVLLVLAEHRLYCLSGSMMILLLLLRDARLVSSVTNNGKHELIVIMIFLNKPISAGRFLVLEDTRMKLREVFSTHTCLVHFGADTGPARPTWEFGWMRGGGFDCNKFPSNICLFRGYIVGLLGEMVGQAERRWIKPALPLGISDVVWQKTWWQVFSFRSRRNFQRTGLAVFRLALGNLTRHTCCATKVGFILVPYWQRGVEVEEPCSRVSVL